MLSPNTTLFQSRYLIVRNLWVESARPIYYARDTHTDLDVVIAEIDGRNFDPPADRDPPGLSAHLKSLTHPAMIGMRDHFFEADRHYLVTRPVNGTSFSHFLGSAETGFAISEIENGLRQLTAAMSVVELSTTPSPIGLNQANIWVTSDNEFKLLYFGSSNESTSQNTVPGTGPRNDFAFQPLENIWDRLDRASRTTIANTYDDGSLDVLESPADLRADMFSLGALFYRLVTGRMPFDALERSIEILDGNHDPLDPPHRSNPEVSPELSEFIMKLMRLRREDRFDTFESAYRHLNAFVPERERPALFFKEQTEESDVLEIPGYSPRQEHGFRPRVQTQITSPGIEHFAATSFQASAIDTADRRDIPENYPAEDPPVDQSSDDRFYATEILLPLATQDEVPAEFVSESRSRPWFLSPMPAVIIVAVLVTASVIAYLALGASNSEAVPSRSELKTTAINDPPARSESMAVPASTQLPADSAFQPSNTQTSEPSKEKLPANPVPPSQAKPRPQVADSKQPNKPDGAAPDPSKAKKKVTVDDLINDN